MHACEWPQRDVLHRDTCRTYSRLSALKNGQREWLLKGSTTWSRVLVWTQRVKVRAGAAQG